MSIGWLKCQVSKGMFSDEVTATYKEDSFFVPKDLVRNNYVKVRVYSQGDDLFAIAPTDYHLVLYVSPEDIQFIESEQGLISA